MTRAATGLSSDQARRVGEKLRGCGAPTETPVNDSRASAHRVCTTHSKPFVLFMYLYNPSFGTTTAYQKGNRLRSRSPECDRVCLPTHSYARAHRHRCSQVLRPRYPSTIDDHRHPRWAVSSKSNNDIRRTIRRNELRQMVPLADSTIYEMEQRGEFPRRFALTPRCVVWDLAEVEAWLAFRRAAPILRALPPDVNRRLTRPVKGPDRAPRRALMPE